MNSPARVEFSSDGGCARVRIKMRKSVFRIFFLVVWLPLITLGGSAVTTSLILGAIPRNIIQAGVQLLWVIVVIFGLLALLWSLFGEEIVVMRKSVFTYRRQILGVGITRSIPSFELTNLRVAPDSDSDFWGVRGGSLVVNRDDRELRFGIELSQGEARSLVGKLAAYFPDNIQQALGSDSP